MTKNKVIPHIIGSAIFILSVCISCKNNTERIDANKVEKNEIISRTVNSKTGVPDSVYEQKSCHKYKEYELCISSTYLNDSTPDSASYPFNPVCLKQILLFYKNDTLLKKFEYPIRRIKQKVCSGKEIDMSENVIVSVNAIKGRKGAIFEVYGIGGCNSCGESFGYYTMNGEQLFFSWGNGYKDSGTAVGNDEEVFRKYGITEKNRENQDSLATRVYSPRW